MDAGLKFSKHYRVRGKQQTQTCFSENCLSLTNHVNIKEEIQIEIVKNHLQPMQHLHEETDKSETWQKRRGQTNTSKFKVQAKHRESCNVSNTCLTRRASRWQCPFHIIYSFEGQNIYHTQTIKGVKQYEHINRETDDGKQKESRNSSIVHTQAPRGVSNF